MAAPEVKPIRVSEIKGRLMRPALTSHFICEFKPPESLNSFVIDRAVEGGFLGADYTNRDNQELIRLSCANASLPGSSLATHEINNDHTGVTERHVYRRQYDQRSEFTFYVDSEYRVIDFFENWMSYIVSEDEIELQKRREYNYRVNFPDDYKTDNLYITKFEKDFNARHLTYQFINAYPISINSMPISYESSELLKCTVSFTYSRYVINKRSGNPFSSLDNMDVYVPSSQVPDGSQIVGSKDINNGRKQVDYLTPQGNILTTIQ